jgi:DNA-directed RNA polymerase subunit N (RpoN/RPB10)
MTSIYNNLRFPVPCTKCGKIIRSLGAYKRHHKNQMKNCPKEEAKDETNIR